MGAFANSTNSLPDLTLRNAVAVPIGLAAILGNVVLILTFLRPQSELHSSRNYSLCLLAVADLICCVSELQNDMLMVMPAFRWINNKRCLRIQTYAIFAHNVEHFMIWVISMDRAMVLRFSLSYDVSTKITVCRYGLFLIAFLYGLLGTGAAWFYIGEDRLVGVCHIGEAEGIVARLMLPFRLLISTLVVVTHIWTYCQPTDHDDLVAKRIRQSILIISIVYVITSILPVLPVLLAIKLGGSPNAFPLLTSWTSVCFRLNFGSNFYIFGLRSETFRGEYKKTLKWIGNGFRYHQTAAISFQNHQNHV